MTAVSTNISFADSLSEFAFSFYDEVDKSGNVCLSPFSVSATLLLLMMGTNGSSKTQLRSALFKKAIPPCDLNHRYKTLQRDLISKAHDIPEMQLSIVNRFGVARQQVHRLRYNFRRDARNNYRCYVSLMDFGREPYTRKRINKWIERRTGRKIKNMIPDGLLNKFTFMVLTNVIYFKGQWKSKFDAKLTRDRDFWVNNTTKTSVSMMYQKSTVMVTDDNELNCKVVELPYKGDSFSMIVILPNEIDGLSSLEQRLTFKKFNRLINKLYKFETEIVLPKFNITSNIDLKTILPNLGVSDIFNPTIADFSHMVRPDDQYRDLYVSDAIHQAVVVVSEEGSEATAATHFVISFRSASPPTFKFTADHPFLFFIRDISSGTILFLGRFVNPSMKYIDHYRIPIMPPQDILPLDDPTNQPFVNKTVNSDPLKEPKKPSVDVTSIAINKTADFTNEHQIIPSRQNGDLENDPEESYKISQDEANNVLNPPLSSNGNENPVSVIVENGVSPVTDLSDKSETDTKPT